MQQKKLAVSTTNKTELAINMFLVLAALLFIGGGIQYWQSNKGAEAGSQTSSPDINGLVERQQAIDDAKQNGQKDYSFSSGFNPGISGQ